MQRLTFRTIGVVFLLVGALHTAGAQTPDTLVLDLNQAISQALAVSPEVRQVEAQRAFAEARSNLARASRFLPDVQATTNHSVAPGIENPNGTINDQLYLDPDVRNDWSLESLRMFNRIEVQALQPIYTWGQLSGSVQAARHGVAVEGAAVETKALEVASRTAELYYGLLLTEELFRLAEEAGTVVNQAKDEIRRLIEDGDPDVDDADEYQVLITEQEFFRRSTEVAQKRITAQVALARQLFLPPNTVISTATPTLTPLPFTRDSLSVYLSASQNQRPELDQAEAGIAARSALVDVARSDLYPKLFAGFTFQASGAAGRHQQPNPYVSDPFIRNRPLVGLGFQQKLNFGQTRAKIEQARAELNEVTFQHEAAQQLILFEVEEAYRNLITAEVSLQTRDESLRLSKEWLRSEQVAFDLEIGDTENLVLAVRQNLELEAGYFDAVYTYNLAVLRLLKATGILVQYSEGGTLVESTP